MTTLTDFEVASLRQHLGYGAISVDAYPYTPDGFQAIFDQVIGPNITTGPETTCASVIPAGMVIVTPASMTGIVPRATLVVDVGDDAEVVIVASVSGSAFAARFARAHSAGSQIAVMSGTARLRILLHRADQAWSALQDPSVGATSGLASVDKGDVVWFAGFQVLKDRVRHYRAIVAQISSLVDVPPRETGGAQTASIY